MPKRIRTMVDFVGLEVGQVIRLFGRDALYLGLKLVETCVSADKEIYNYFPHILRAKSEGISGDIELIEIRSLENLPDQKVHAPFLIHVIGKVHAEYLTLKRLLITARLIPEQARVLDAFTTRNGSVVKPVWYYETDGRLNFRECKFGHCFSLADLPKTFTETGVFAETIEEAYEKSRRWADEN
jgi:hypothetical protein